jgi:hypothetical protein
MNDIQSLVHHGFHRWKDSWNIESSSQSCGTRFCNVGDSNKPSVRNALESAGVKLAYVAGSNQSNP